MEGTAVTASSEQWDKAVAEAADEATKAAGKDGSNRKDIETVVIAAMRERIEDGDIDPPDVEAAVKRSLDRLDKSRRTSDEEFRYICDALADGTILGVNDPMLDLMAVVGTGDGLRKINRYLTAIDLDDMTTYRRRKALEHTAAYGRYADAVDALKQEMRARNATMIGDMFLPPPE